MNIETVLNVLSKPVKLKLLVHLYKCINNECDVNTFVELFSEKQPNISKHLNGLRKLNIINSKKDGKFVYYYMTEEFKTHFGPILDQIIKISHLENLECKCIDE
ncbi:transcriptional regulator [Mycoplasma corogypsi]|uniref:transcriptional regulator n=1 Tax=Mycoplasma corogypsi TaxID=2106 RepID=UPI003872E9C1